MTGDQTGTSDAALARRVRLGDRHALEQIVERYLRPVQAVIAAYLDERADIEDAVQDTFVRALAGIGGFDAERAFAPWLYQVARNVARDRLAFARRMRTQPLDAEGSMASDAATPDVVLERKEKRTMVAAAMRELPEQQRTAFRLHDVEGYSTAEVGAIMGLTAGTVRSHVHYARKAIRAAVAGRLREPHTTGDSHDD